MITKKELDILIKNEIKEIAKQLWDAPDFSTCDTREKGIKTKTMILRELLER